MPSLPWSCMWPWYNEGFVPAVPAPTLLGNPTPPPLELPLPSSLVWGWEGDCVCTWMEPPVSWEAIASHSSRTELEVAFPLLGQDLAGRGPSWEGRSHPGPQGATFLGSCSEVSVWSLCSLSPSLPSRPLREGRLPWHLPPCCLLRRGPTGLSLGGQRLPLGI